MNRPRQVAPPKPLPHASLAKIPRQRRSVEMVHALLDAAIIVLMEEGTPGFSTNRVAEVAGASPGSLYQYFANKEMLIAGVVERGLMESELLMRASASANFDANIEVVWAGLLTVVLEDLRPYDRLLREVMQVTPMSATTGIVPLIETRVADLIRDWLTQQLDRYRPIGGPAAVATAARAAVYLVLRQLTDPWSTVDDERFIAAAVPMLAAGFERIA